MRTAKSMRDKPKNICPDCFKKEAEFAPAKKFASNLLTWGSLYSIISLSLMMIFIGLLTIPDR
ncbi:MAG: hypothetical protein EA344_11740 [Alkalicoccus sp.]|nr:MAG: hypothetical protein EA344_11740 [Alkalicoccus sp.]